MQKLLLLALFLSLVSCSKKDPDPTPTPATPTVPTGHWVADGVYVAPVGADPQTTVATTVKLYQDAQLDLSGSSLTVSRGVLVSATTDPATTSYTLTLPVLKYPAQAQGVGRVDSFVNVTSNSFTWRHYSSYAAGGATYNGYVFFANFHR